MTIKIVTDSTCDLPAEVADRLGITIVPMYINLGQDSFQDGVNLTREEFYARLPDADPPPTTAVPGPQLFQDAYARLGAEGASQILSIHISRSLSAVVDSAEIAAKEASIPVTVLDGGSLSLGTGYLAWAAAEAAAKGSSMDEIVALVKEQGSRTHVFAALDTLEFLRRSGRMNRFMAALGSLIQIKPLLRMHAGSPTGERIRTSRAASARLLALLEELLPLERVALVHTHSVERAQHLRREARHLLPEGEILSTDITPVFGAHLGPGAVGFVVVSAR
jgi:DegV family protein with EDD domain